MIHSRLTCVTVPTSFGVESTLQILTVMGMIEYESCQCWRWSGHHGPEAAIASPTPTSQNISPYCMEQTMTISNTGTSVHTRKYLASANAPTEWDQLVFIKIFGILVVILITSGG